MSKYNCDICNIHTNKKTDYSKHIKTKKHLEKVSKHTNESQTYHKDIVNKNIYKCPFCENTFTRSCNLSRHKKACGAKEDIIKEKDNEIKDNKLIILEKEIKKIQKESKEKENFLKKQFEEEKYNYKNQLATYEKMLSSLSTPQAITNYTYISNAYPNTPALEGRKSYANLLESTERTLMEILTMYYKDKRIISFIGDYIIKYYKKKEPKDQSMWSSDIARLTYIISSCAAQGTSWTYDKKGTQMKKIVIDPALNYIRQYCYDFCQNNSKKTTSKILEQMLAANEIIQYIDSGKLADDIVKYIAPEFSVKQVDTMLLEHDETIQIEELKKKDKEKINKVKEVKVPIKKQTIVTNVTKVPNKESDNELDSEEDFIKTLRELKAGNRNYN